MKPDTDHVTRYGATRAQIDELMAGLGEPACHRQTEARAAACHQGEAAAEGKTSPEELLAASHASCYAMALSAGLGGAGTPPQGLEVSATDPLTFAIVSGLLAATALAACGGPALKAARVDPIVALRCE